MSIAASPRRRVSASVLAVLAAAAGAHPLEAQKPLKDLDAYVAKAMAAWQVPGMAIAVVKDDSVVFAKGYGVREVGKPAKVDENTLFAIGSSSKAFTVALIGTYVDEGKMKWDDPATKYLPELEFSDPYRTREETVRDLVTHRTDISRSDALWYGTPFSRDEILRRVRYAPSIASFRSAYNYNNLMFLAAGQAASRVGGKSWDELVYERVLRPLGMNATNTSTDSLKRQSDVATPHYVRDGKVVAAPWRNIDNIAPAGSINSNVVDMAKWVRFQLGDGTWEGKKILARKTLDEMHAPQTIVPLHTWLASSPDPINALMVPGTHFMMYGLAWFMQDYRGRKLIGHGGAIDGMRAQVAFMPEEDLGVVILTNLDNSANNLPEAMIFRLMDEFLGGPKRDWAGEMLAGYKKNVAAAEARMAKAPKPPADAHPTLPLEKYAGTYADSLYGEVKVSAENGKLVAQAAGLPFELEHYGYDTFRAVDRGSGASLLATFTLNARGVPERLTLQGLGDFQRAADAAKAAP